MAIHPHILIVEDDDIDAEALIRAFKAHKVSNPITRVADGVEALAVLRGGKDKPPLSQPHLILLDLNLPRMNGLEFLSAVRQDEKLKQSIVFVLTTSNFEGDKTSAYTHNVAGYVLKDTDDHGFSDVIKLLDQYQSLVEYPQAL